MNFFAKKTTWSNWELWLLKVCLFSGGIAAGLYFYSDLGKFFYFLVPLFIATAIWATFLWIFKMNQKTNN